MLELLNSPSSFRAFFITLAVLLTLEMIALVAICRHVDDLDDYAPQSAHVIQLPTVQISP